MRHWIFVHFGTINTRKCKFHEFELERSSGWKVMYWLWYCMERFERFWMRSNSVGSSVWWRYKRCVKNAGEYLWWTGIQSRITAWIKMTFDRKRSFTWMNGEQLDSWFNVVWHSASCIKCSVLNRQSQRMKWHVWALYDVSWDCKQIYSRLLCKFTIKRNHPM